MANNPKKEKIVNTQNNAQALPTQEEITEKEITDSPLAPFDPRLKETGEITEQANEDPLNGVNE